VQFAKVLEDRDGRSKGCGIVEFSTPEGASDAIEKLTDSELKGRKIFVREDREDGKSGKGGGGDGEDGEERGPRKERAPVDRACYNCGKSGHISRDCTEAPTEERPRTDRACYNCGKTGHISRDCTEAGDDNGRPAKECYNCGKTGHISRDCPEAGGDSGRPPKNDRACYNCGKTGHISRDCNEAKAEGGEGTDRGPREPREDRQPAAEGTQLFVGNLSWETGWQDLKDHFREYGEVERADVAMGRDRRSKGFGFIRFATKEEAADAIEKLNGVEFMGREIEVRLDNKA